MNQTAAPIGFYASDSPTDSTLQHRLDSPALVGLLVGDSLEKFSVFDYHSTVLRKRKACATILAKQRLIVLDLLYDLATEVFSKSSSKASRLSTKASESPP